MSRLRVLVVDPDPESRTRSEDALEGSALDVTVVDRSSPEGARQYLVDHAVDCVVTAAAFEDGDWTDLVESVRGRNGDIPIVMFPAAGSEALASDAISVGIDEYIARSAEAKPFEALSERIEAVISIDSGTDRSTPKPPETDPFFDVAGTIVLSLSPQGRIRRVNEGGAEFLGYDREELLGRDWFAVALPPPEREEARKAFEALVAGEREPEGRARTVVETRAGDSRTIEWRNEVRQKADGTVEAVLRAGRDVTEQAAQARLVEAERDRFAALFENIPEPAIVTTFEDGQPIVRRVNREFERVFGYEPEAVIGENIDDFIVPADDDEVAQELNDELTQGESVQAEATRLTAAGPREFRLHVVPLKPGTENVEGYAIYEDITELKSRQRVLEGLHGAATDIVGAESAEAACERTVEAARELLEFDLSEISLAEDGYLVPVAASEEIDESVPAKLPTDEGLAGKTYRNRESYRVDELGSHPDASPQGPYRSAISVPIGSHGVFQAAAEEPGGFENADIELAELLVSHTAETLTRLHTERALRDREERLRRQNERLEKFTSVLSHDLRNPLNVAAGELELAIEEREDPHLRKVANAHERMRELIDDVLTLARQDQTVAETEPMALDAMVESCFSNVETAHSVLDVETAHVIYADTSMLQSLFENLFRNAVQHGRDDVKLTIGGLPEGFYVADDGPGIPPEEREDVLEPGYSTDESGTGLGLNIVAETAAAHGWDLTITDSDEGGARFEFRGVDIEASRADRD